ncbi:MAG TPA: GNAT family N-acetyltransferase [Thermoanaerobaculia bacterium]
MPADERFTIRAFRNGDEAQILRLFARSFHAQRSPEHFDWKYRTNPHGRERISVAFDAGGILAAHYAGYPVAFREGRRDLVAHQVGDTMTEVAVRHIGRGPTSVLGRTALHFYANFCERQVAFNYGFNVANIQKFSLRFLRSDRVEPVTYRVMNAAEIVPMPRWERLARGYRLQVVQRTDAEWDRFFERVAPAYGMLLKRDARYVQWRYLDCPDVQYIVIAIRKFFTLAGWMVFRIREDRLTIGDALFDPDLIDAPEVLLRHVVPHWPATRVDGWFPPRPAWFDIVLGNLGFEKQAEPQDLSLMCVPFMENHIVPRMREALYYTWGDSDLF